MMNYAQMKKLLLSIDNPVERLELMMDFGRGLSLVPDGAICAEITGCASFVQICQKNGKFYGQADSDVVRGIVAIVLAMVDDKTTEEIKAMDIIGEFQTLNLNLGVGRLNGLNSIADFLKNL